MMLSQRCLLLLMVILQSILPLVHAHAHTPNPTTQHGIHFHDLAVQITHAHKLIILHEYNSIIKVNVAIKKDPTFNIGLPINSFHALLKYSYSSILIKHDNDSPPYKSSKHALSLYSPRAPPFFL